MSNLYTAIKQDKKKRFIRSILERPLAFEGWSLQGFGMLRLYLTKEVRLHVWDSRFMVPNVSLMHTHPWDFTSYVVAGSIENWRMEQDEMGWHYLYSTIQCGPGGGIRSEPASINLVRDTTEVIREGSEYHQAAEEIHESHPLDGTVTVVERVFKADTEHAKVFWAAHTHWVSAEPRKASEQEVESICHRSLAAWFYE